ncbi:MAG: peptidylprolyl isomerase [Treponema sp.]|nr:peptidylprolyl isomerase [Treponema sp.]MBR4387121.1 peptidylprolyl isomerase [Treponema sp.]
MEEEITTPKKAKKDGAKIGAVIILVISAIVFIPTGGSMIFEALAHAGKTPVFGSYKGQKIEYKAGTEFADRVSYMAELYKAYGQDLNQNTYYSIFTGAFEGTLRSMVYSAAVKKANWSASKDAVNRAILPRFYDENGKYSEKLYNQTDDATKADLRKTAATNLAFMRYNDDVMGSDTKVSGNPMYGLKTSSKEKSFIAAMDSTKRSFELAAFSTNDFPKEEAAKYGKANPDKFKKLDMSAITLEGEDEAKSLLKQIKNNEVTFEDAISEKSTKYYTDKDGKLSVPYYYGLLNVIQSAEDAEKTAALAKGTISDPVQTKSGWTIFRTDSEPKTADFNDEATVTIVLDYLKSSEKGYIENFYAERAKAFISEAKLSSFDDACEKFSITKADVAAFPVNYGNSPFYNATPSDVSELAGLSTNESVLEKMFKLKKDEMSEPFVLASNVIVARCTGIQKDPPAELANFDANVSQTDQSSSQTNLKRFDGVVDSFMETYFKYFIAGNEQ